MGWTPQQVDACELWQFAAAMGMHEPPDEEEDEAPANGRHPLPSRRGTRRTGMVNGVPTDTVVARLRHARGEGPAPTPKPAAANAAGFAIMGAAARQGMVLGDGEVTADAD